MTASLRSLLAAIAIAAVLSYGLSGHGLPQVSHEGMAGAGVGICMLLAAALGSIAAPEPEAHLPAVVTDAPPSYKDPLPQPRPQARARASPAVLQRFLN